MSHVQTQSEWEEEMSEKILQFIRHELYLDLRYMEPALSALSYRICEGLLTFATDGNCLRYSSEPLLRVFQTNAAFLDRAYLHVIFHCVFKHLWMTGSRERGLWNIACDIAAEYVIDSMDKPCTKRILSWLRIRTYDELRECGRALSAAVVYRWLKSQNEEKQLALAREFYTDDHRLAEGRRAKFSCGHGGKAELGAGGKADYAGEGPQGKPDGKWRGGVRRAGSGGEK